MWHFSLLPRKAKALEVKLVKKKFVFQIVFKCVVKEWEIKNREAKRILSSKGGHRGDWSAKDITSGLDSDFQICRLDF